ncbi:MAG TPA: hypothetical protein PLF38_06245 [Xylanibacter oryzae]|nr:hypothetical protein [Xylanibacter oryzae]
MRIFIISNRLPIKIIKDENDEFQLVKSEGGLATGLDSLQISHEKHWVGLSKYSEYGKALDWLAWYGSKRTESKEQTKQDS